jgi:hypothetical protein
MESGAAFGATRLGNLPSFGRNGTDFGRVNRGAIRCSFYSAPEAASSGSLRLSEERHSTNMQSP